MKIILSALTVFTLVLGASQVKAQDLKSDEIKQLITGKRVVLATDWGSFPLVYNKDGRVSGDGSGLGLARFASPKETGSWWVAGDRMCQQFPTWYKGKRQCFRLKQVGPSKLEWVRQDGYSGTASISG